MTPLGYSFTNWEASGISLDDSDLKMLTFTMPEKDVTIKAVLKRDTSVPASIELSSDTLYIKPGERAVIKAKILPEDTVGCTVVLDSKNKDIATVTQDGEVQAIAEGQGVITAATSDGSITAECYVTAQ